MIFLLLFSSGLLTPARTDDSGKCDTVKEILYALKEIIIEYKNEKKIDAGDVTGIEISLKEFRSDFMKIASSPDTDRDLKKITGDAVDVCNKIIVSARQQKLKEFLLHLEKLCSIVLLISIEIECQE